MSEIVLEVKNLYKSFELSKNKEDNLIKRMMSNIGLINDDSLKFDALSDISFSLKKGEMLGIIGKNGSGKSTLLKILSEIMYPTKGEITYKGKITSILEVGTGFHPELTGKENAIMYASLLGIDEDVVIKGMDEIIEFSEIGEFINQPVKFYSSGMYLRLAFAVAFLCNVEIMILDEVLSVGDSAFMVKSHKRIQSILADGTSIILVSHSMSDILRMCNRCIWLEEGKIKKYGPTPEVVAAYLQSNWWTTRDDSGVKSVANLIWNNNDGPQNDYIKLLKFSVSSDKDNIPNGIIDYNDQVLIEIEYEQLAQEGIIHCVLIIIDHFNMGVAITTAQFSNEIPVDDKTGAGKYSSTCRIAKQLLNVGYYRIYLRVAHNDVEILEVPDIAIFQIVASDEKQDHHLKNTPMSVSASFDWQIQKLK